MGHLQYWGSEFPPHFLSIVLPFFTSNLQKLDHLCIHFNYQRQWTGNRLKSLRLRRLSLPNDFVRILPSTLEAYESGAPAEDDPLFSAQYLKITWLNEPPGWIESREDSFFQRVTSLDIGVSILLQLQHTNLQGTTFRPMPYLQELKVSIRIN
ncbi:hypothetical protein BKA70DRAFT_1246556, partial [Coprinopsis sp. MPI-PUGE-AT-0042]